MLEIRLDDVLDAQNTVSDIEGEFWSVIFK